MQRVLLLMTVLLLVNVVEAQPSFPTTIRGCVEEEDGDVVTGTKVTVDNVEEGTDRSDTTDDRGCYQVTTGREFQLHEGDEIRVHLTYGDEEYEEFDMVGEDPVIIVDFVVKEPGTTFSFVGVGVVIFGAILAGIFLYLKYHPLVNNL